MCKIIKEIRDHGIGSEICKLARMLYFKVYSLRMKSVGKNTYICSSFQWICGLQYIELGSNVRIGARARIEAIDNYENTKYAPSIIIGNNVIIGTDIHIGAIDRVQIDDNVLMASHILIEDHSHGRVDADDIDVPPIMRKLYSKGPIHIGENVWIGENVVILAGVTIGRNSIIGANSVVVKDIPPYSVVAGSPAKVLRNIKDPFVNN